MGEKSPEVERFLEETAKLTFNRSRLGSIRKDICVQCGRPATNFRDEISKREFTISGFCQSCQDKVFGV